jgi:hypothetical protein
MFKKIFGNGDEKPEKMTRDEALEILMENIELRELRLSNENVTLTDNIENEANSIVLAEKEIQNFNDASEIVSILKAMKLEAEKLIDPSDIEKIKYNKKVQEAIRTLTKSDRPYVTLACSAAGFSVAFLFGFIFAVTDAGQKLDLDTRMNILYGTTGAGAIAGLVFSESGYRKRKEEDLTNANIEDILAIRDGISKKLELPESLATVVKQHIEDTEFAEVYDKLVDSK